MVEVSSLSKAQLIEIVRAIHDEMYLVCDEDDAVDGRPSHLDPNKSVDVGDLIELVEHLFETHDLIPD